MSHDKALYKSTDTLLTLLITGAFSDGTRCIATPLLRCFERLKLGTHCPSGVCTGRSSEHGPCTRVVCVVYAASVLIRHANGHFFFQNTLTIM